MRLAQMAIQETPTSALQVVVLAFNKLVFSLVNWL